MCSLIWVLPPDAEPVDRAGRRFLERIGGVVDVSGSSAAEGAAAIRLTAPDGIVCLVDKHLGWTAQIAEQLGLLFHSRATADRLTDKIVQRSALRDHGLPTPRFWNVDDLAEEGALRAAMDAGFPMVLKPRRGTSSQDTERIDDEGQLRAAIVASEPGRMLLEGFISDPTTSQTGAGSAPYVSVELIVSHRDVVVLGITGRTPLAPPFRETGFVFPADVSPALSADLIEVATAAAAALGVESGALHVEIKCTDDGPVVIEVNGRPGGHAVHPLLRRALGIDTVQLALQVAIGQRIVLDQLPAPHEVVFRFDVQPDADIRVITAVDGLESASGIPGVEQVIRGLGPGDAFSWRSGTLGYVAAVLGAAPDHASARDIRDEILHRIVISGTP